MSGPVSNDLPNNYNVEDYFPEPAPEYFPKKERDYRNINLKAVECLSAKLGVHSRELIEKGRAVKVYSAALQLERDADLISRGKTLVEDIIDVKAAYQTMSNQLKEKCHSVNGDTFNEYLGKCKRDHEGLSEKWGVFEGRNSGLIQEVAPRVKRDKLLGPESTKELIGSFSACYQTASSQIYHDLQTLQANTLSISHIPSEFQTAMSDAKSAMPDFCYYFCYRCYLCSEKIAHSFLTEKNFLFWYNLYWYNFIDNDLIFNESSELQKLEEPDPNKPIPQQPSYFFSENESDLK
jgi:hypothetical protein